MKPNIKEYIKYDDTFAQYLKDGIYSEGEEAFQKTCKSFRERWRKHEVF